MATLQELERALINADAAGDVEAARALAAAVRSARQQAPAPQDQQSPGMFGQVARQVGLTARHGIEGIANTVGLVTDPITYAMNDIAGTSAPTVGQLGARAADAVGLPTPQNSLERVVGSGARAMAGAAPMVGAGRLLAGAASPVTQSVGRTFAADAGGQVAAGAGGGSAAQAVQEAGGGAGAQLAASVAGAIVAPGAVRMADRGIQAVRTPINQPQIVQDANEAGVLLMTSDAFPPRTFVGKFAQSAGEKIPVAGTGSVRSAQNAERIEAVKRVASSIGGDLSQLPDEALAASLKASRVAEINKYTALKGGVFDKLQGPVGVSNVTKQIDDEVARISALNSRAFDPLVSKLDDFKTAIQGKDIRQVEELRKQLGNELAGDSLTNVKSTAEKSFSSIYRALNKDIEGQIKKTLSDRDVTKWKVANKRLSESIGEMQSTAFKRALDKGDVTPETVRKLLLSKNRSDVQLLYKNLTPKGRSAARTAIIQEAVQKAGGIDSVSPQKFANALDGLSSQTGIFFKPDQKQQADGLIRVIKATQRASEAGANPMTGQTLTIPVISAWLGSVMGGAGAIATGGSVGGVARVYESAPVRNMMIKLAQTPAGSKQEADIVRRLLPIMQQMQESNEEKQ